MKPLLIIWLVFFTIKVSGQTTDAAWESAISTNYQLGNLTFNTSLSHRSVWMIHKEESRVHRLAFVEINQFATRKVTPDLQLSLGYKYRRLDPSEDAHAREHRTTLQAALTHHSERLRWVSRLRAEQRFRSSGFAHRYRYRISMDMPLSGLKLDAREFYLVASNELLIEVDDTENSLDDRISLGAGYLINDTIKVQIDITRRIQDIHSELCGITFVHTHIIVKI